MAMTVRDLMTELEKLTDDTHVAIAYQPHFPKTEAVTDVVAIDGVLYIAGGPTSEYMQERVRRHLQWDSTLLRVFDSMRAESSPNQED